MCGDLVSIKKPSFLACGPLYENANFCPCWSYAQDQLPHFSAPCLTLNTLFFPTPPHMRSSTSTADINMPGSSSVEHSSDLSISDLDYMLGDNSSVLDPKSEDQGCNSGLLGNRSLY